MSSLFLKKCKKRSLRGTPFEYFCFHFGLSYVVLLSRKAAISASSSRAVSCEFANGLPSDATPSLPDDSDEEAVLALIAEAIFPLDK